MKYLIILCLLSGVVKGQDTLHFVGGVFVAGEIQSVSGDTTLIKTNGVNARYSTYTVSKFSISDANPNKSTIQKAYLSYLDNYNKGVKPTVTHTAGYYLKRGANNQLAGLGIGLGASLIGAIMVSAMEKPTAGYVVIGVGGLVGGILNLVGIADYRKAGELLDKK